MKVSKESGEVDVLTGDGILRLIEVQAAGGEKAPAAEVVQSIRATLGLRTSDLLARIEALEQALSVKEMGSST